MRALIRAAWGGPVLLAVQEMPDQIPKAGEILRRVKAAGVNFPDVPIIQNNYQVPSP